MSVKLNNFINESGKKSITDDNEIIDICRKLLGVKLKEIKPAKIEGSCFKYVITQISDGFELDVSKFDDMTIEELLFFLMASKDFDYFKDEPKRYTAEVEENLFTKFLSSNYAESLLIPANNSTLRKWLNINFESYLDTISKKADAPGIQLYVARCRRHLLDTLKLNLNEDTTIYDVLMFITKERRKPWLSGVQPIQLYREKIVVATVIAHFVAVDSFDYMLNFSTDLDTSQLVRFE